MSNVNVYLHYMSTETHLRYGSTYTAADLAAAESLIAALQTARTAAGTINDIALEDAISETLNKAYTTKSAIAQSLDARA